MERITINLTGATSKDAIQDILVNSLPLPEYYGRNLDALNDCLSTMFIGKRVEITLIGLDEVPSDLAGYVNGLRRVFMDAAAETYKVSDPSILIIK